MQKISALKTIADILFIISLIPILFGLPLLIMYNIAPDSIPPGFTLADENIQKFSPIQRTVFFLMLYICYAIQVYALYLFKETMGLFKKKIFFDDKVAVAFTKIGRLIITSYLIYIISYSLLCVLFIKDIYIDININILTVLGVSYFFTVLGSIFKKAKEIKEENQLTI